MQYSTVVHSTSAVTSSSNIGANLPSSSLTLRHFLKDITAHAPSCFDTETGPHPPWIFTPSRSHSPLSSTPQGISSYASSEYMSTDSAPNLTAVLATSYAILPPPITTTLPLSLTSSPTLTLRIKSIPAMTPFASEPGIPRLPPDCNPIAT